MPLCLLGFFLYLTLPVSAQTAYQPTAEKPEGAVLTMASSPADDAIDTIIELEMVSEAVKK